MSLNGLLLDSELAWIPGANRQVRRDLLPQVVALRAAFRHRFGYDLYITDGYRPKAEQIHIFVARYTRIYLPFRPSRVWGGKRYWQKYGTAAAAVPGTSNHGWATAFDFGSGVNRYGTPQFWWMVKNAPAFGFHWPEYWARAAREWWHFEGGHWVPVGNYIDVPGVGIDLPDLPEIPDPIEPEDFMATMNESEKAELLALARYLNKGREGDKFIHELPDRVAAKVAGDDDVPPLTNSEMREILALARYLKKNGEGDKFIHEIPGRVFDKVKAFLTPSEG